MLHFPPSPHFADPRGEKIQSVNSGERRGEPGQKKSHILKKNQLFVLKLLPERSENIQKNAVFP